MEDQLVLGIIWYAVFVFSATFHEAAHAFIGYKLGDPTAFHGGQVTLNPIPHIQREPIGMIVVPWLTFASMGGMMGWASAPYNPQWAEYYPKKAAFMALAGPGANLILCIIAFILLHIGLATGFFLAPTQIGSFSTIAAYPSDGILQGIAVLVSVFFSLNLLLCLFNLIPVPPLDGTAWLEQMLQGETKYKYKTLINHPTFRIFGIIIAWIIIGWIFEPIFDFLVRYCILGPYGHRYELF